MTPSGSQRNAALEGLRGLAALAVLGAHVVFHLGLVPEPPSGAVGVLVFFVLSGYLIARIVVRRADTPGAYRAFVRRRVVRLGPVVAALAVVAPVLLVATGTIDFREGIRQGAVVLMQTTAIATAAGAPVHTVLVPTWSLTVEWTFYLLLPVWVWILRRRGRSLTALARDTIGAAVVLYLAGLLMPPVWFYMLPVANLGVMLLGAALGLAHHAGWTGPHRLRLGIWPGGAAFLIVLLAVVPTTVDGWGYKLVVLPATAFAAALVINGCMGGHPVQRLLSSRFLTLPGARAYSLYLWNLPILYFTWRVTGSSWVTAAIALAAIGVVVEVSYRALEVPLLRGGTNALQPAAGDPRRSLPTGGPIE